MKLISIHDGGALFQRATSADQIFPVLGVRRRDESVVELFADAVEQFLRLEVQRLVAVDAEVLFTRGVTMASGTLDRASLLGLVTFDFEPVELRVRALVTLVSEAGHVAGGVFAAALPPLAFLDSGLFEALEDEPARVRLPEVGRRDVFRNVSSVGSVLEVVEEGGVARPVGAVQLTPEIRPIVAGRVSIEPPLDVRDRRDQVDRTFAFLAVDVDAHRVIAVEDVTDAEVVELSASQASLELERDERPVAIVVAGLDHCFDVLFVGEEVAFGGDRIEVVARSSRDPLEGLGRLIELLPVSTERSERGPVVLVRMFVGVLLVDPADDRVSCGAVVQREAEESVLLEEVLDVGFAVEIGGFIISLEVVDRRRLCEGSHPSGVTEDLEVSVVADLRGDEADVVRHSEEVVSIGVELDVSGVFAVAAESRPECFDLFAGIGIGHIAMDGLVACKCLARSRPLALTRYPKAQDDYVLARPYF